MSKFSTFLKVAGIVGGIGFGATVLSRRGRAAPPGVKRPKNMTAVDGKLGALRMAGAIGTGGTYIILVVDEAHRTAAERVVAKRARANPQWEYVIASLDLVRELSAERDVDLPEGMWGGVAAIRNSEIVAYSTLASEEVVKDEVQAAEASLADGLEAALPPGPSVGDWALVPLAHAGR